MCIAREWRKRNNNSIDDDTDDDDDEKIIIIQPNTTLVFVRFVKGEMWCFSCVLKQIGPKYFIIIISDVISVFGFCKYSSSSISIQTIDKEDMLYFNIILFYVNGIP